MVLTLEAGNDVLCTLAFLAFGKLLELGEIGLLLTEVEAVGLTVVEAIGLDCLPEVDDTECLAAIETTGLEDGKIVFKGLVTGGETVVDDLTVEGVISVMGLKEPGFTGLERITVARGFSGLAAF